MEAIVEADQSIERALEDAHLPTLMAALALLERQAAPQAGSRSLELLREAGTLVFGYVGDYQGKIAPALQARMREHARLQLAQYRDAGCPAPDPAASTHDELRELMSIIGGQPVPDGYLPLLMEALRLEGRETTAAARAALAAPADAERLAAQRAAFGVLIIGAGMSGLAVAVELTQRGIPFTILEKNQEVGGTWLENTYPGCRVDSSNHLYSYSFETDHAWPLFFSTQDVLLEYFRRVADKYGLRSRIRFGTEVVEARWDELQCVWSVRARDAEGREQTLVANLLVSAVGQLNRPRYPAIPGRERFAGTAFHSARWDHGFDLRGKRVAVIGTGASAFQFVPEIAKQTAELLVFQRTPPWLLPTPNYHEPVPAGLQWLFAHVPNYARWYRFWLFWLSTDGLRRFVKADPDWHGEPHAIGADNEQLYKMLCGYIRRQIDDDPALLSAAIPDYPPGGKRMLRDNGQWLATLKRDDVRLITEPIAAISERGVITEDGREHAVDALIYGTGFQASDFLQPMTIVGRGGLDLHAHWAGDARAYLGMTMPAFPNLFLLYGPNTNIVVNGSIIFFSECAARYIAGSIDLLLQRGLAALEVRSEVHDAYNARVDAENARMAWGAPQVVSWYKNEKGRVSQNWPFALVDYWDATREPDPADYRFFEQKP
jgi:4-hydroxyacetophenone monooxygenase